MAAVGGSSAVTCSLGGGCSRCPLLVIPGQAATHPALPEPDTFDTQRYLSIPKRARVPLPFSALTGPGCQLPQKPVTVLWCRRLRRAPARRQNMQTLIACASTPPEREFHSKLQRNRNNHGKWGLGKTVQKKKIKNSSTKTPMLILQLFF